MIKNINNSTQKHDIRTLIERYMSGETTNEEEATLRTWFRLAGEDVPEEWRPLRAMFSFVDEERLTSDVTKWAATEEKTTNHNLRPTPRLKILRKPSIWTASAVAAAAIAMILLVPAIRKNAETMPQNYAVIDGKVYTNPKVIKQQADDALEIVACEDEDPFSALDMMQ